MSLDYFARADRMLLESEARVVFADVGGCVYRTAERMAVPVHEAVELLGLTSGPLGATVHSAVRDHSIWEERKQ